jgi:hypothetical protein
MLKESIRFVRNSKFKRYDKITRHLEINLPISSTIDTRCYLIIFYTIKTNENY